MDLGRKIEPRMRDATKPLQAIDSSTLARVSCEWLCHRGIYVKTGEVSIDDVFLVEIDEEVGRNNRDKAVIGMILTP